MGEIKHTPWVSEFAEEADCWIVLGAMSEPDAEGVRFQPGICSLSDGRTEAEARAIAAAPEMKEALIEARTTLSITRTNIMVEMKRSEGAAYRFEGVPEILKARIDAIDATLAKANGEAPQ